MSGLRRRLSWVLAGWFLCQLPGIVAPLMLAAAQVEQLCTCPEGSHGTFCPMHRAAGHPDGVERCRIQSAAGSLDIALLSLAGGAGVLPARLVVAPSPRCAGRIAISTTDPSSPPARPDSPPPRP